MNKRISNLNITEENKILLLRMEKKVDFLSKKTEDYFGKSIQISSKKIEEAYSVNEDLISILRTNDVLVKETKEKSHNIRIEHQNNFTKELTLDISLEASALEIIDNTLSKKEELANANDKLFVLKKWEHYMNNQNKKRKEELSNSLSDLELRMEHENILEIKPMAEDIKMIQSLINPKDLSQGRKYYLILLLWSIISIVSIGALIWTTSL